MLLALSYAAIACTGDMKSIAKKSYNKIRPYDGGHPGDSKDVVLGQTYVWTKVWCPLRSEAVPLAKPEPVKTTLPVITAAEIRRKAAKYPAGKQLGCDNWWMRDLARLPDDALAMLSHVYSACETARTWPE